AESSAELPQPLTASATAAHSPAAAPNDRAAAGGVFRCRRVAVLDITNPSRGAVSAPPEYGRRRRSTPKRVCSPVRATDQAGLRRQRPDRAGKPAAMHRHPPAECSSPVIDRGHFLVYRVTFYAPCPPAGPPTHDPARSAVAKRA